MLVVVKEQDDLTVSDGGDVSVHDIIGAWGQHDCGHLLQADDQGQVLQGLLLQLKSEKLINEKQAKLEAASSLMTKMLHEELRGRVWKTS